MNKNHGYQHEGNHVYTKNITLPEVDGQGNPINAREVLVLRQYQCPTENEVMSYLIGRAKAASEQLKSGNQLTPFYLPTKATPADYDHWIEYQLTKVHPFWMEKLLSSEEKKQWGIKGIIDVHTPARESSEGDVPTVFVRGKFGCIQDTENTHPVGCILEGRTEPNTPEFYEKQLDDISRMWCPPSSLIEEPYRQLFKHNGYFNLRLGTDKRPLADESEMDILLKFHSWYSLPLEVRGSSDPSRLNSAIGLVYSLSQNDSGFCAIPDISQKIFFKECCMRVVEEMENRSKKVEDRKKLELLEAILEEHPEFTRGELQ